MQKKSKLTFQDILETDNQKILINSDISIPSNVIKEILSKGNNLRNQTVVIALDSVVIQNNELLDNFIENVAIINSCGAKILIVHDYINLIEHTFKIFDINDSNFGSFITVNNKSAKMIEMVLSGYINKNIVTKLCETGCYALGISGKDGNLMQAHRSKLLNKRYNEEGVIDIGFVCEPLIANPDMLNSFGDMDIIPVIAPVANDEYSNTHVLDMNLTAITIAEFLNAEHLILPSINSDTINKNGIVKSKDLKILKNILNINDPKQQVIYDSIVNFLEIGNNYVHLVNPAILDNILLSLFIEKYA